MRRPRLAATAVLLLALVLASPAAWAGNQPRRVKIATSIVQVWSPSQHLYVKGDVGVSGAQLRELELWLTKRAPHWTVVLLESAEGERFVDADGSFFQDIAAAQHALGKGLSNRTGFGSLMHPKTGEPDGAIFLLSLRDRNLSYFGSEAQDRRGLGDEHWMGELDARAIFAMRNGGRVLDAARDTITSIDERLERIIQGEFAEQERTRARMIAERETTRASLHERLHRMTGELDALVAQQQELFEGAPSPGVPRAQPDVAGLSVKVATTLAMLEPQRASKGKKARAPVPEPVPYPLLEQAKSAHEELRASIDAARQGLETYRQALARLKKAEEELLAFESHRLKAFAAPELADARAALAQVRPAVMSLAPSYRALINALERHSGKVASYLGETARREQRLGELPGLLDALEKGRHAGLVQQDLVKARTALGKARAAFSRQERSFEASLRASEESYGVARARIQEAGSERATRIGFAFLCGVFTFIVLAIARFRRVLSRRGAMKLHAQWRTALDEKLQALFGLLDRTHLVAGRSREDIEKRYSGITRERALKLASDVDELFLLSVGASRVLGQAEALLSSVQGGLDWFKFHFMTRRFVRVTHLLRDEPIVFHPDEGIELVLRGRPTDEQRLIGALSSYQPFSLSFEALVEAFNTRAANALDALDALESAPDRARDGIAALERLVAEVRTAESKAVRLCVPTLIERVVPSLEALLAHARALLSGDPIAALEGPLTQGERQGTDTSALLSVLARGRSEVLPTAERAGGALVSAGLPRGWLDETLEVLTRRANEVARELVARPSEEAVRTLSEALLWMGQRAAECVTLVGVAGRARAGLTRVAEEIDTARAALSQSLGLAPGSLLREEGRDPSECIGPGEESLTKAREALSRGELKAARTGLEAALTRTSEAEELVNRSREAHARFQPRSQERHTEAQRLARLAAERNALLSDATSRYLPSALSLRAGDPAHPEANGTVRDNLREFASHTQRAADLLRAASAAFSEGRLLASASLLGHVQRSQELAAHRLEEFTEKVLQLQAVEARNEQALAASQALVDVCAREVSDPRVMAPTRSAFMAARGLMEAAHTAMESWPGDPFEVAERFSQVQKAFAKVQRSVEQDLALHAEAEQSVRSARSTLAKAQELVRRAATDGITDSRDTTHAINAVESLARALHAVEGELGRRHGDWNAVGAEGQRIGNQMAREAATLRGELRAAERAVQAIERGVQAVRRATHWSGSHGVSIGGSPGASRLADAHGALAQGNYRSAEDAAEEAERTAREAIERAEEEVAERRAEEERRQREEERAREQERERAREQERVRELESSRSSSSSGGADSGFSSSSWNSGGSSSSSGGSGFGSSNW